jgi:hypothetical protein
LHSSQLQAEGIGMKIKCVRAECGVCGKVSTIQVFYNKNGAVRYSRARHYLKLVNGKPQFEYHQQSLDYIKQNIGLNMGQLKESNLGSISQNSSNYGSTNLPAELLYMGSIPIPSSIILL